MKITKEYLKQIIKEEVSRDAKRALEISEVELRKQLDIQLEKIKNKQGSVETLKQIHKKLRTFFQLNKYEQLGYKTGNLADLAKAAINNKLAAIAVLKNQDKTIRYMDNIFQEYIQKASQK